MYSIQSFNLPQQFTLNYTQNCEKYQANVWMPIPRSLTIFCQSLIFENQDRQRRPSYFIQLNYYEIIITTNKVNPEIQRTSFCWNHSTGICKILQILKAEAYELQVLLVLIQQTLWYQPIINIRTAERKATGTTIIIDNFKKEIFRTFIESSIYWGQHLERKWQITEEHVKYVKAQDEQCGKILFI